MRDYKKRIINFSILYFFLALLFSIVVWGTEVEEPVGKISQLLSPVFLYIYPLFYFVIMYASDERRRNENGTNEYYALQFPDTNIVNRVNELSFSEIYVYLAVPFIFFIVVVALAYGDIISTYFAKLHGEIWLTESLATIISVVAGIYAILLAFFPIIIGYLKEKCMFFEPFDLPIVQQSKKITIISLIIVVAYILLSAIAIEPFLLGVCELIWMILIVINTLMYIWMFIMPIKIEKRVLKKLDRLFGRKRIFMTPNKKWWKGNAIKYISDLVKDYEKILNKIKYDNIENIEFGSLFEIRKENTYLAIKAFYFLASIAVGVVLMFGFVLGIQLIAPYQFPYFIITSLALMPLLIPLLDKNVIESNYVYINSLRFTSTWGYYIKLVNKKSTLYVTSYDSQRSKYQKYIVNLKRIGCFFNLAINMNYEDVESFDSIGMECLCNYVLDASRRNRYKNGLITPVLLCACLSKEKKEENMTKVKEMLRQIDIDEKEKKRAIELSFLVLRDMYGNDNEFDMMGYKSELLGMFD